jgi:2-phospho-L-lactate guanylyltransferase
MSRPVWAIIPVKALSQAKRRLAPVLPDDARRRLVLTMLEDVLDVLGKVATIDEVLVVTPDARVAELAEGKAALLLRERHARGLNAAVRCGLAHAAEHGATRAIVLPADVPLATPAELHRVVEAVRGSARARVTLVPAADGDGTNALAIAPPDAMVPSFGPGSFVRHLAQAVARRLDVQVLQLPGLATDIDTPRDLARLLAHEQAADRYGFLQAHAITAAGSAQPHQRGNDQ